MQTPPISRSADSDSEQSDAGESRFFLCPASFKSKLLHRFIWDKAKNDTTVSNKEKVKTSSTFCCFVLDKPVLGFVLVKPGNYEDEEFSNEKIDALDRLHTVLDLLVYAYDSYTEDPISRLVRQWFKKAYTRIDAVNEIPNPVKELLAKLKRAKNFKWDMFQDVGRAVGDTIKVIRGYSGKHPSGKNSPMHPFF